MDRKHISLLASAALLGLALLTGCGPSTVDDNTTDVDEPEQTPVEKKITLTVGNVTIDSSSHMRRINLRLDDNTSAIADVSTDDENATIVLGGDDAALFQIKDKKLSFKNPVRYLSKDDKNHDGAYDVDIKAIDET